MNPRAAGAAALQNTQRFSPLYNRNVPRVPGWWNAPPGGWNIGGAVDSTEALIAERDRLQQQLQTADEAMAQEIMAQIMEINKELEMAAAPGMAGGGVASLMGYQGGGEVTWQNATPEQWAALNRPAWAPEGGAWSRQARRDQHLAARGLPPSLYTGANKRYLAPHLRRAFSGPPVSIPPGGG